MHTSLKKIRRVMAGTPLAALCALSDKSTREFLQKFMTAYADWVERNAKLSQ